MNNIICTYCKKSIHSKEDLLLGTHFINNATPYHVKCFDKAKNVSFLSKPVMKISPSQFNFFIGINVINIIIGIIFTVFSGNLIFSYPLPGVIIVGLFGVIFGLYAFLIGFMFVKTFLKYKKL